MNEHQRASRRHLLGFKRFQNAALRALAVAVRALKEEGDSDSGVKALAVKVSDMKSLVSAYKEAVAGERMVLGIGGAAPEGWPDEMVVRWVEDDGPQTEEDEP